MKYVTIFFLMLSLQSFAQITGNLNVIDSSALHLDAANLSRLKGKWKLIESVEYRRTEEQTKDQGLIVDFGKDDNLLLSWGLNYQQKKKGEWEILNNQTIKFSYPSTAEVRYLAGEWVVYKLTDQEMILAKVLTSSGDWRKLHYFSRNISHAPLTETSSYCTNCTEQGNWCWGEWPSAAKQYWAIINDPENTGENLRQFTPEVKEGIDWLLLNAPCISSSLYLKAKVLYTSLSTTETNDATKKQYTIKLAQIKAQQQFYFKE